MISEIKDGMILINLRKIQLELKAPKGQYNEFSNFYYRNCEDIYEAVKPLLNENGLVLFMSDELVNIGERYYIKATATLTNGIETITNTAYAREEENKKGMDGSQITGASSSYARKYALNGLFLIDDVKDSDFTNTGEMTEEKAKKYTFRGKKHNGQTILEVYEENDTKFLQWCLDSEKTNDELKTAIELITPLKRTPIPDEKEQVVRLGIFQEIKKNNLVDECLKQFGVDDLRKISTTDLKKFIGE